jgi:hypothetical protein
MDQPAPRKIKRSGIPHWGPLTREEHIECLKEALRKNLKERFELDGREEQRAAELGVEPAFDLLSVGDLCATPHDQLVLDEIIKNPVLQALRRQMRWIGQQLFTVLGSTDAMREIAEEVANEPGHGGWGYKITVMDKNWDGVGEGNDRWWC